MIDPRKFVSFFKSKTGQITAFGLLFFVRLFDDLEAGHGDGRDLDRGVFLPMALPAAVASLVLVVNHVDLGAGRRAKDLGGDLVPAKLGAVADHLPAIHDQHGRQRHGGTNLTGKLVNSQDVVNRRPFLPAAAANNRVHEELSSPGASLPWKSG